MAYDAREYLRALTPPTFTALDGSVYTGRILSHHERAQLLSAMAELGKKDEPTLAESESVFRLALGMLFADTPSAVDAIMTLPPEGVQEALLDFLASQRRPRPTVPLSPPPDATTLAGTA